MKISFEIDEERYRQAICVGLKLRRNEEVEPYELNLVPSAFDVCCALSASLGYGDMEITNVEYER